MTAHAAPVMESLPRRRLGGLPIVAATPAEAASAVIQAAQSDSATGAAVHLVNAYSIALAQSDGVFRDSLSGDAYNFPDGKPLSWVTRLSKHRLWQVRGPQFFHDVMDQGRESRVRHFLLGGSEELLVRLQRNLEARHPGVVIAGAYSPPFRPMSPGEIIAQDELIRDARADIVWVGLGTPKQDLEVRRLATSLTVVACAVGAAFDFTAGTKREAPRWMTTLGVEWVFRLLSEPKRLWRRYLIGNFVFIAAVIRNR
ncbi:WecB/TagA/CpsF family glycosyltransferase [Curtobacterium sp. BRB10]|uniref:WecB/TagA/CpsF family glycosyltransferase n=1 Tax=Curtobacterium sp. BRB10 TaxID=2962579 RepID=UPI0028828E80|nr:WecB/TagA/CpsF family glycosyltransferase [Curtobacterium sp. BRB10]MDT0234226.1 WecB/TagA/CpsF family glycosyltransferase [Curtobacterium sp. BRB10]